MPTPEDGSIGPSGKRTQMSESSVPTGEGGKSRFSNTVAFLGWIVAIFSLGINFLEYRAKQEEREAALTAAPKYTWNFSSLNLKSFPPEIREIKKPVRQPFALKHLSGEPVRGLHVAFRSDVGGITGVVLDEGGDRVNPELRNGGKELDIKKDILLQGEAISGYLTTDGLVEVTAKTAAEKGQEYKPLDGLIVAQPWYLREEFLIVGIALGIVLAAFLILRRFAPSIVRAINDPIELSGRTKLIWVIAIGLLMFFGRLVSLPGPAELFYALLLYLLITNLASVTAMLRYYAFIQQESQDRQRSSEVTARPVGPAPRPPMAPARIPLTPPKSPPQ
jgi:hypothetical protein